MFKKSTISPDLEFLSLMQTFTGSSTVCRTLTLFIILLSGYMSQGQTQSSGIRFRPVGGNNTSIRIDWTSGASTAGRIVIIKNATGTFTPTNGANISTLSANSNFTTASDLDPSTNGVAKAVYAAAGAGTTVPVSNLVAGTQYFVQVYEFTGTAATPTYLTTTNSTNPLGFIFYTADGSFTVPIDVTTVTAQAWGAGGGGGEGASTNGAPGGGGGAYAIGTAAVTFGVNPAITVGTGGVGGDDNDEGSDGESSSFGSAVIAMGGTQTNENDGDGSAGGSGGGSTGNIDTNSGGAGGNGGSGTDGGGGGGSSASTTGDGVNGGNYSGDSGGAGGNGDDGDGGDGGDTGASNAQPGTFPGGGGGGRGDSGGTSGAGANGLVIVSFKDNTPPTATIVRQNPTAEFNNSSTVTFRVTFNEFVSYVDPGDFTITLDGTATGSLGTVTANSGLEYDIEVTGVSGNGTIDLDFVGGQNITDISGNPFGGTSAGDETYTIDTTAPVISGTAPVSSADVNNSNISYTLSEAIASGTITWTRTGGTADGSSPHIQALTGTELTSGAHSDITLTNSPTLVSGAIYSISFDATDAAGNTATTVTNTNVTFDNAGPVFSATAPATSSSVNNTVVSYTLDELLASGTITWTRTGGTADAGSPHVQALTASELTSGAHSDITLTNNPTLVDGTVYTISFDGLDALGNAATTVTNTNITFDATDPVISGTTPASSSLVNNANVSYTLSEAIASGTITWTRTGGTADGGSPHVQALAGTELDAGVHANITLTNNPALVDGAVYSVAFNATDLAGNTATTITNTDISVDNVSPVFSTISPASSSYTNNTRVSYTLSESIVSGTITWTRTSGSADGGSPHVQALTGTELASGAHSNITLTNSPTLVNGTVYSVAFNGTDAAGNAASAVTSTSVTFDTSLPAVFTVGSVTTVGGTVRANYWNGTNTSINIVVPITNDASLNGGFVQLRMKNGSDSYTDIGAPSAISAINTNKTINILAATLTAHVSYEENEALNFTAVITDAAGNARTGTQSTTALVVDTTPPAVASSEFFASLEDGPTGNDPDFTTCDGTAISNPTTREFVHLVMTEPLSITNGQLPTVGTPGFSASTGVFDVGCSNRGATAYHPSNVIHLQVEFISGSTDGAWDGTTTFNFTAGGTNVTDLAGNEMASFAGLLPSDTDAPVLATGLVFNPNGTGAEIITFAVDEALNASVGTTPTGFTTVPADGSMTQSYNPATRVITLTSSVDGTWTDGVTVSYDQTTGNIIDPASNELAAFTGMPIRLIDVGLTSNNANTNSRAKAGNTITLPFTTTTALTATPTVTIDGQTATVNGGPVNYTATLVASASLTEGVSLPITINAVTATDVTDVTVTTNGSQMVYDATPPSITPITLSSDNVNGASLAKPGNTVTLSFSVNETLFVTPSVTIGGRTASVGGGPLNYTATLVLDGTEPEGVLAFNITLEDLADNGASATATTNASSVTYDKTLPSVQSIVIDNSPPVLNGIGTSNGTTSTTLEYTITFNEDVTGADINDFILTATPFPGSDPGNFPLVSANITSVTGGPAVYTLTANVTGGTGQLRPDFVSDGTVTDAFANINTASFNSGSAFSVVLPEPNGSSNASGLSATPVNTTTIQLNWSLPALAIDRPSHYLIRVKGPDASDVAGTFPSVNDGTYVINDTDFSDGNGAYNFDVITDVLPFQFNTLLSGKTYDFEVIPYNLSPNNSNDNVNFRTTGNPSTSASTPAASVSSFGQFVAAPATISSLATTFGADNHFRFRITDDGATPAADNAKFRFSQLVINAATGVGGNTIPNWSDVIAEAQLSDNFGNVVTTTNITSNTITFATGSGDEEIGEIDDNEQKIYSLKIRLKDPITGGAAEFMDGLRFECFINSAGFTYETGSSQLNPAATANSDPTFVNTNNTISVLATQFDFSTHPNGSALVLTNVTSASVSPDFSTTPVVRARDIHGNTDLNYSASLTITNADGIPMSQSALALSGGIAVFPAGFQYQDDGDGTLTVSDGSIVDAVSNPVTVNYSNSTVIAASSGLEPPSISSLSTSPYNFVFDFQILDDNLSGGDGSPTRISQIVITQGPGNEIIDWAEAIEGAILYDGVVAFPYIVGTINSNNITFSGMDFSGPGTPGYIVDNGSKFYELYIWLKNPPGGTLPTTIDNLNFVFQVLDDNVTLNTLSSNFTGTEEENSGAGNVKVEVTASQLVFTTQPPSEVLVNSSLTASPIVEARDANGNRDLDYANAATITNAGTLGMINTPASFASGVLTFPAGFQYTQIGNGQLTVSASGTAAANSTAVTVRVARSTLITAGADPEPATISSLETVAPGAQVFDFTVTDDASTENDGNPTQLTDLYITNGSGDEIAVHNWANAIAGATLTDGTNIVSASTIGSFYLYFDLSSVPGMALGNIADNASKTYKLNIWLRNNLVGTLPATIDGLNFEFDVQQVNIGTQPTGSSIVNGEFENSGTANEVTVEATQIDVISPAAATAVSINTNFTPVFAARDANGNTDIDFEGASGTVTEFTNASAVSMANGPIVATTEFTDGLLDFSTAFPNFHFTGGNNNEDVTLSMKAGTGTNCGTDAICTVVSPTLTLKSTTITAGPLAEPTTLSSIATSSPGPLVFDLTINDDDLVTAGTDGLPTLISQLVITQATGNDITDWTELLAGARLDDGSTLLFGTVNPSNITFSGMNVAPGGLGHIGDNVSKTYRLRVWLRSSLLGALPSTVDNLNIAFEVLPANITTGGSSSTFGTNESENSGATNNAIDVDADRLIFATNPAADLLVNKDISLQLPVPVIEAQDINGNRDLDYNSTTVTVTNEGGLPMTNAPGNLSITNGLLTFDNAFRFNGIGNGDITVASTGPTAVTAAIGADVVVRVGVSGTIIAGGGVEPATISSLVDTDAEKIDVFDFTVNDDPGGTPANENDGNPMLITGIVITQQSSPNNTITDWTEAIAAAELFDGTNTLPGTVNSTNITFNGMSTAPGALGYIADDDSKTYTLRIYLRPALGGTLPTTIDGLRFGFQVVEAGITTDPNGTSILGGEDENSGSANEVTVIAIQLDFTTPATATTASLNTPFAVVVEARDENENRDLDFNGDITALSTTGGLTMINDPDPLNPANAFASGVFSFDPAFQYTSDGGGTVGAGTLNMDAGGISGTSPSITVQSSFESLLKLDPLFTPILDIPYINHQDISNQATSFELARFELFDGDGITPDDDGAPTNIDDITLSITNPGNMRSLAIYDGTTLIQSKDNADFVAGSPATATFENLSASLVAPDNGSHVFTIRASFYNSAAAISDNDVIQLHVENITQNGGSQFNDADPGNIGGILGGVSTDPNVRIEVTATQLDFMDSPEPIEGINQPLTTEPIVHARDANDVLDLDFNFTANISSSAAGISTNSLNFVSGVLDFTGFEYTSAGTGTLAVTANALSSNAGGSTPCTPVDVLHTTAIDIPAGSGGVLGTSNIKGGTIGAVVFGFTFNPEHKTATHPSLNGFTITFDNAFKTSTFETFKNFKVFESTTGTFTGSTDVTALTGSVTIGASPSAGLGESDMVIVSFGTPRTLHQVGVVRSYFLVVDVDPTANISTPHLTPQLIDNGFGDATNNNIVTTQGSATASLVGQTYQFASTRPPQLLSSSPSNGQLNVDPDLGQIDLYFDVKVLTFDGRAELYDRNTNKLIAALPALNGQFTGDISTLSAQTVNPISFEIPDGVVLKPDSLYYLKIAQGAYDPISNQGTGISDEGQNFYGGISYNGTLYFKISSPNPPVMLATDPIKYFASNTAATFNATFDQFGTAYYLVLDDDAITTPTKAHIDAPLTYPQYATAYVAHGSFDIEQVSPNPQFASFTANLAPGEAYSVWIYAENDAQPVRIQTSAPYGGTSPFTPGTAGPTLQITVPDLADISNLNQPIIHVCPNSEALITDVIIIGEEHPGDFDVPGTQNFNILLPTGFSFDVDHDPSVILSGSDFLPGGATATFVNSTILNISFTNQGAGSLDNIIISDFKILASTTGAIATITRFAGNGLPTIPNNTVLATLYANPTALQEFTNTYTTLNDFTSVGLGSDVIVNVIPDNFNSPVSEVRLIPEITPTTDYGSSFFNGPGVTNDILNLTGVALNTSFDIAMTHTDLNGCVSEKTEQYLVYDHTAAIPIVGTEACVTNVNFPNGDSPTLATPGSPTLNYNAKAGFNLTALYAGIPDRVAAGSQVIYGSEWESLVNQIPVEQVGTAPVGYKNYKWDYSFVLNAVSESNGAITINPYNNDQFADTTINNNPYWRGGSLGLIEFIGIYRSTADLTVIVPFRQEIELFLPPIPVIEVSGQSAFAGSTPIFCEEQPDIVLNGFPLSTAGVSTGSFVLRDSASNAIIYDGVTQITGFKDNGNGTANLTPKFVSNLNNTIRVEYTYQDNNSPCSGTGVAYIRIAPNPTAAFTYISNNTPNTPDGNGECERIPISFDASESEISKGDITYFKWNFNDALNSSGSNQNAPEGQVGEADMVEHTFNQSGAYGVSLIVTSNYGCLSSATTHPIDIGAIPDVAFSFRGVATNEPMTFSSQTLLESSPAIDDDLALLTWNFGDGSPTVSAGPSDEVLHTYVNPGKNTVTLSVTSDIGCVSDLSRLVVVVPKVTFDNLSLAHLEDFQTSDGGYQFLSTFGASSSWEHGVPAGNVINDPATTNQVWTTGLTSAFSPEEKSALYTTCFNLEALDRPIITFNSFVNVGTGDGVVLEYSTDNRNIADPDKQWVTLGTVLNGAASGVNWYNGVSLPTKPGQQETGFGWTGAETTWQESKHALSGITNRDTVVFRFSFASGVSDPTSGGLDGFAIDDLRVGNGTRTVLLENFTNTGVEDPTLSQQVIDENNAFREFQETSVGVEVIKIDYHVGFPGEDPFNQENAMDPGARALYYNIAAVPETRMDGLSGPSSELPFSQWGEQQFSERILFLAEADINLTSAVTPEGELSVTVNFTPLVDFAQPTLLHVAILEENVTTTDNPSLESGRIATGETDFKYVLRKMLPNAAGTKYNTLTQGQVTDPLTFTWSNANLFNPEDDIVVVAFLQDESTRRIYQAEIVRGVEDPSVVTGIEDLNASFNVYPNPADKELIVTLPHVPTQSTIIQMFDQMGKVVNEGYFDAGQSTKTISTENFAGGVYVIQVRSEKGILRRKVMVVHRN